MRIAKLFLKLFAAVFVVIAAYLAWDGYINYHFDTVVEGKVYKSAAIPPEKLEKFVVGNGIRTVIDLRHRSQELLPQIEAEAAAIAKMDGVRYVNIPSPQKPTPETLAQFFAVLDKEDAYPVLIHCYHGVGRTEIYSSIYLIEYENMSNDAARLAARPIVEFLGYKSTFAIGRPKGDYLMSYQPRREQATASVPEENSHKE